MRTVSSVTNTLNRYSPELLGEDIVYRIPHSGIVRLVNIAVWQQATVFLRILRQHGDALLSGAIVTAYPHRIRIRLPDKT